MSIDNSSTCQLLYLVFSSANSKLCTENSGHGGRLVDSRVGSVLRGPGFNSCFLPKVSREPAILKFVQCKAHSDGVEEGAVAKWSEALLVRENN